MKMCEDCLNYEYNEDTGENECIVDMDMDDTVDTVLEDELDAEMNDTAEKFKNVYKDATQGYQTGKADFIAGAKAAYSKQTRRK